MPSSGTAFISVNDADKPSVVPIAAALAGLGFELVATDGTSRTLRAAGLEVGEVAKVADAATDEQTVVDLVREGRCDLIVNTPQGSGARADGYRIREAALSARVPCITTISGAAAAVHAIANARAETALSLQERIGDRRVTGSGAAGRRDRPGRPVHAPSARGRPDRARHPGQFFMLQPPGHVLPRPMSLCLAQAGELCFLIDPIGPGTRTLCGLGAGDRLHVLGPLGNGFDLTVATPADRRRRHRRRAVSVRRAGARESHLRSSASARPTTPRQPRSSLAPRS